MLYLRRLFHQDITHQITANRDGSILFFKYDYTTTPEDRAITFTYKDRGNHPNLDNMSIKGILHPDGSESRINGEFKSFLINNLNAKEGDILLIWNNDKDNTKFTLSFVEQSDDSAYPVFSSIMGRNNHIVAVEDESDNNSLITNSKDDSVQKIWYGAPGTGKSNKIKEDTHKYPEKNVIRTTFHPDSDYATFVGSYKPTMEEGDSYALDATGKTHKIEAPQHEKISYKFIPQALLQAYCMAWKKHEAGEKVFLVIEEINRGNCAQIFGDIFQLLDRSSNGFSTYAIKPDEAISKFLKDDKKYKISELSIEDVYDDQGKLVATGESIKNGEKMVLPNNLYIWATMNTSDQSLFPIDSAFKRRWDWEYVPIKYSNKDWKIVLGKKTYSWVAFQEKINDLIFSATDSEDKQMGDYFVIADKDNNISEDVLFNKIVFYLWNDVSKDGEGEIFKVKRDKDEEDITFSKFLKGDKTQNLQDWMSYLGIESEEEPVASKAE